MPFAVLLAPVAVAKLPFAVLFVPVAVVLEPLATAKLPYAVALRPVAFENVPTAVELPPVAAVCSQLPAPVVKVLPAPEKHCAKAGEMPTTVIIPAAAARLRNVPPESRVLASS